MRRRPLLALVLLSAAGACRPAATRRVRATDSVGNVSTSFAKGARTLVAFRVT